MNEHRHSFDSLVPKSDLEEAEREQDAIQESLKTIGDALSHASQMLDDLENEGVLGPAIRRYAIDLANEVGKVAKDLDPGTEEEEHRKWAKALLNDAQSELALLEENSKVKDEGKAAIQDRNQKENELITSDKMSAARAVSQLSEDDLMGAIVSARTILLDVEDALRNIGEDEAEEIADVGLAVSKMFLFGIQNIHSQISPGMITNGTRSTNSENLMEIEYLDDEDDAEISTSASRRRKSHQQGHRTRILWPPIGPAFKDVLCWGKDEAVKSPVLSCVLAMVLWPTALIGAFIGGPILAADWCLQSGYNSVQDQPFIETAEKGASNLFQVGRFYFLVSKLVLKQGIRVGKRQINRRGGVEQVARDITGWSIDRALHPVESAGMLWNSAKWGAGMVVDGIKFVHSASSGEMNIEDCHHPVEF